MKTRNALLLLLLTSFIWGFAFVAQSTAAKDIGPFTYNAIRMLLGALSLVPFSLKTLRSNIKKEGYTKKLMKGGMICGCFLAIASYLQQFGIAYTTAGKAGFITSLYILFVPVISLFFGKKNPPRIWICVAIGLIGAYLLSVKDGFEISKGDLFVSLCAICFCLHILSIDKFGKDVDAIELSMVQFATAGAICSIGMFFFEKPEISSILSAWIAILYSGVLSCAVAYTLQVVGQKYLKPAPATLALSLESVWAAIGGALILKESMNARELVGCIILFASVIVAQLPAKSEERSK